MDPEIKQQLAEIHALARENHRLLRAVRRHQMLDTWGKYILWLLFIVGAVGWVVTYLEPLAAKYTSATGTSPSGLFGLPTSADIQKLINSYKATPP
ncbi:hypothetical protein KGM48_02920 [Patescibacteria group bacterium]|nr:hypothetical protein [Patescibacteria group bacterium]